jgi:hypothetical protein
MRATKVHPRYYQSQCSIVAALACLADAQTRSEAFLSLLELNSECIELLVEQAHAKGAAQATPIMCHLGQLWRSLSPDARRRAAACPYLLVDIGFSDTSRWDTKSAQRVSRASPFFTVPRAASVARRVFVYAWHLSQSHNSAAQVLLGMPERCADLIASRTLTQVHELADKHPEWMAPRWPTLVSYWRDLLLAAECGKLRALLSARMRGLRLLATEGRIASFGHSVTHDGREDGRRKPLLTLNHSLDRARRQTVDRLPDSRN